MFAVLESASIFVAMVIKTSQKATSVACGIFRNIDTKQCPLYHGELKVKTQDEIKEDTVPQIYIG